MKKSNNLLEEGIKNHIQALNCQQRVEINEARKEKDIKKRILRILTIRLKYAKRKFKLLVNNY